MAKCVLRIICLSALVAACEESSAVVDGGADLAWSDAAAGVDHGRADGGGDSARAGDAGVDMTPLGIDTDMDGNPRTVPWSIGAHEQD